MQKQCSTSAESLWRRLHDIEQYASMQPSVQGLRVSGLDEYHRILHWEVLLRGSPLRWSQREILDKEEMRVSMVLSGGDLKYLEGNWQIHSADNGSIVTLDLELDFGFPRIAAVLDGVLVDTLTNVACGVLNLADDPEALRPASGLQHHPRMGRN